jgi:3'(2'), 5'-bisphosphate nucleotidase
MPAPTQLLPEVLAIADRAGALILEHYAGGTGVATKADRSPVTAADEAAERLILAGLAELTPEIPVVAEEAVARGEIPDVGGLFWLVDPLDGTREFLSRNGEFTVNIGLVEGGQPLLGVVTAPAKGWAWWGAVGHGACRREAGGVAEIRARARPSGGTAVAVASRSHRDAETDAWLAAQGITDTVSAGSSLKFCLVAEGKADVYPRFGTTMEWDTAAGHAVLRAAGGRVRTVAGEPFGYGKPAFRNPGFIAEGA